MPDEYCGVKVPRAASGRLSGLAEDSTVVPHDGERLGEKGRRGHVAQHYFVCGAGATWAQPTRVEDLPGKHRWSDRPACRSCWPSSRPGWRAHAAALLVFLLGSARAVKKLGPTRVASGSVEVRFLS